MGKEKSHIPVRVSLKFVPRFCPPLLLRDLIVAALLINELGVSPVHFLPTHIEYLSFLRKIFYKFRDSYFSDLWKPIPATG